MAFQRYWLQNLPALHAHRAARRNYFFCKQLNRIPAQAFGL